MSRGRVSGGKAAAAGGSRLARDNLIKKAERATLRSTACVHAAHAARCANNVGKNSRNSRLRERHNISQSTIVNFILPVKILMPHSPKI